MISACADFRSSPLVCLCFFQTKNQASNLQLRAHTCRLTTGFSERVSLFKWRLISARSAAGSPMRMLRRRSSVIPAVADSTTFAPARLFSLLSRYFSTNCGKTGIHIRHTKPTSRRCRIPQGYASFQSSSSSSECCFALFRKL